MMSVAFRRLNFGVLLSLLRFFRAAFTVSQGGEHAASGAFACARGMALLVRGRAYLGLSRLGEALR